MLKTRPTWLRRRGTAAQVILETRVISGTLGGPDKTILNSPRFLASTGYETVCAYMHPPGDPAYAELRLKAQQCDVKLLSVVDRGPWDWRVVSEFLTICRRERVTIWHGHDYKSNVLGLLIKRFWPMHMVTTVHGWVTQTRRTPVYYKIDELCLPRYDAVICVSDDLRARSLKCGVPADRCWLVENGIDTNRFTRTESVSAAKTRWSIAPHRFTIGAVGRLSAEKGFDVLIRAVHLLKQQGVDLELLIAGTGDAEAELRKLIAELEMASSVRLLGNVAEPRSLFETFDLFVLSSYREGLPNVLLEAMALEIPVVATSVNGVPLVLQDGASGVLVQPGAPHEIARAIQELMNDADLRARLAASARQTVLDKFSFADRMKKVRAIYDTLIEA